MKSERNNGIDLLRLVLMYMVCMLHTLGKGGVLNACRPSAVRYGLFWLIEILCYCAVDGFALISGYMATDRPCRFDKLINMWFQAVFYSLALTVLLSALGMKQSWSRQGVLLCAFPMINGAFWYFTAYTALFFVMPILNRFVCSLEERAAARAFLLAVMLFSVINFWKDPFSMQQGYSAPWLMVLYSMGALARRGRIFETKKSITLMLLGLACTGLTWVSYIFWGSRRLMSFVSPTILLNALVLVILFSRLRLKGTLVARLSPLAFGIYLFQSNQVIWHQCLKDAFVYAAEANIAVSVIYVFACAALIFIAGLAVECVRSRLAARLGIPALSRKMADAAARLTEKAAEILR